MSEALIPTGAHDDRALVVVEGGPPGQAVARLNGDVDIAVAAWLTECLVDLATAGDVIVDMAGVRFIDSTGMGVLVTARNTCTRCGHEIRLRNLTPKVTKTMALAGLDTVFTIEP